MRYRSALLLVMLVALGACGGGAEAPRAPVREPLSGDPAPALLVTQAQFVDKVGADGKPTAIPGAAKLLIVRQTKDGWKTFTLEDPDSNVFHKALPYDGGILTIGGDQAMLKLWHFRDGQWTQQTLWNPTFGGKFNRLRDFEIGDVDGDGKDEIVIATHDQGVIVVVHPDEHWRVEEIEREPWRFVHEIEIGDVDGDHHLEFFATVSQPNKLDQPQSGDVRMFRHEASGWVRSMVDAPADTHAKEVMAADVDRDGIAEVYVAWEGAIDSSGKLVRPVTVKEYRWKDGAFSSREVASLQDRQLRSMAAGDVNGDGKVDIVAGALASGLWLFEQDAQGWKKTVIDPASSGFEHPVYLADLDGDGAPEIYVGSEKEGELRQYRWRGGKFEKQVIAPLKKSDITWNITSGKF
jgi:hypothetical protein